MRAYEIIMGCMADHGQAESISGRVPFPPLQRQRQREHSALSTNTSHPTNKQNGEHHPTLVVANERPAMGPSMPQRCRGDEGFNVLVAQRQNISIAWQANRLSTTRSWCRDKRCVQCVRQSISS